MSYKYTVICDGGKKNHMTYGSFKVFETESGRLTCHRYSFFGYGTSNTSEYLALLKAIDFCINVGYKSVVFKTDSLLVVNQVNNIWRISEKAQHLGKYVSKIKEKLSLFDEVSVEKIDGADVKRILGH